MIVVVVNLVSGKRKRELFILLTCLDKLWDILGMNIFSLCVISIALFIMAIIVEYSYPSTIAIEIGTESLHR